MRMVRWMCGIKVKDRFPGGRPKRPREVVKKDCQAHKLNKEDAIDHSR